LISIEISLDEFGDQYPIDDSNQDPDFVITNELGSSHNKIR